MESFLWYSERSRLLCSSGKVLKGVTKRNDTVMFVF